MRIKVDLESDALYFRICETRIHCSKEVSKDIILDYDRRGEVIGIEVLGIKRRFHIEDLSQVKVELPTVTQN
jgi:uncharacterized protein YuzE